MVFVVEDSKNTREKDKVLTNISKEVKYSTQEGEVKGYNQTMSMPLCSSGVTGYHNGCEACDNTGGWWCGWDPLPDLTYTCGRYCLHRMCGPNACVPDPPSNNPPTAPTSLLTNGQTNPTGITSAPYFSAVFNDPDNGNTGVHYRIQVNTNSSFNGTTMWDSNKTAMTSTAIGARSPNITYNGTTLPQNGTTYYWRIKFWDNNGAEGAWSSTAQFTMNTPPQFSNISNNGPKDPNTPITFNTVASNNSVNGVKLVLCKTPGVTGTECDGGESDTYCTSNYVSSNPSCSWDIPMPYADGPYYAYPYIFSIDGKASDSSLQGQAHTFTVANVAPTVTEVTINGNDDIDLVVGGTKTVPFTTTVKDNNGCQNNEISTVKGYLYRSGVGYTTCNSSGSSNANNCYPEISCSMVANSCSSSTGAANYTCSTSFEYYTDPTDNVSPFSEESWLATVKATDNGQGTGGANPLTGTLSITGGVNVNSLLAFNITNELNYGPMFPGGVTDTLNKSTTITSGGNIALNHLISGVDMCDDYPTCTGVIIPAIQQRYSLDNNTPYHIGSTLSNTPATILTNLAKQTTSTPTESTLWWGIKLPEVLPVQEYTGLNTITSVVAN